VTIGRRIAFAVTASWFSRFVTIALNLILIPVLFRHLGKEELGIWFMLGQSAAFLGLMDLGITPTLTRRIALARGKSGSDPNLILTQESRNEIADLIATGKIVYRYMTTIVFVIAWLTGYYFITQLNLQSFDGSTIWIVWTVMCLSHAIGVWASMWTCVLQGIGFVGWDALLGSLVGAVALCSQIAVVVMGGGLIGLAVIAGLSGIIIRFGTLRLVRRNLPEYLLYQGRFDKEKLRSMLSPAFRAWFTGLGAFMILKTDQYFIAYFKGAGNIPDYHAAYQVISNLYILAVSFGIASSVFVSHLWQEGNITHIHAILQRNLKLGLGIMVCGIALITVSGRELFSLWLGNGHFIGYPILIIFSIMLTLEVQHVIVAATSRATEDEAFALWALGSGFLNLIFTWVLIKPLGLLGVALGTCLAQLLTNNWYVLYRGFYRLQYSALAYTKGVIIPTTVLFTTCFAADYAIERMVTEQIGSLSGFAATVLTSLFFLLIYVWINVLSSDEKSKIASKININKRLQKV
jgi:O-antigen/teichoic acid export membrane protein